MLTFVFFSTLCRAFAINDLLIKLLDFSKGKERISPDEVFDAIEEIKIESINSVIDNLTYLLTEKSCARLTFKDLYNAFDPILSQIPGFVFFKERQFSTLNLSAIDFIDCEKIATIMNNEAAVQSIKQIGNILGINNKLLEAGIDEMKNEESCKKVTLSDISRALDIDPTYLFKFIDQLPKNNDVRVYDFLGTNMQSNAINNYYNLYSNLVMIIKNNLSINYNDFNENILKHAKQLFGNITEYYSGLFTKFIKEIGRIYTRTFMIKTTSLKDKLSIISPQLQNIAKASNSEDVKEIIKDVCDVIDSLLKDGIRISFDPKEKDFGKSLIQTVKNITANTDLFNIITSLYNLYFYKDDEDEKDLSLVTKLQELVDGFSQNETIDWIIVKIISALNGIEETKLTEQISALYQVLVLGNTSYVEDNDEYKYLKDELNELTNFVNLSAQIYKDVQNGKHYFGIVDGVLNGTEEMKKVDFFNELNKTLKLGDNIRSITSNLDSFETLFNKFLNGFGEKLEGYGINTTKMREDEEYFAKPIKNITETVKNYSRRIDRGCNASSLKNFNTEIFNENMTYRDLYKFFDLEEIIKLIDTRKDLTLRNMCNFFYPEREIDFSLDESDYDFKFYPYSINRISESLYNDINKAAHNITSLGSIDIMKMITKRNFSTLFSAYNRIACNIEKQEAIKVDDINDSLVEFGYFFGLDDDDEKYKYSITTRDWLIVSFSIIGVFIILGILSITLRTCNKKKYEDDPSESDNILMESIV